MTGGELERPSDSGTEVRVVIVDDQLPFRRAAAAVVERPPGFRVVGEGASGEQAIDPCRSLRPDLILLDVQMPGIGGFGSRQIVHREGHRDGHHVLDAPA